MSNKDKEYLSPEMEILFIEMEQGIAAGSAKVVPLNNEGSVKEEWEADPDDNRNIDW